MLKIENLTIKIGKKTILKNICLNFEKGKKYAIVGPNGSGKSTFAQAIMGNEKLHTEGKIFFNSKLISNLDPAERAKLGIFLSFQTPPDLEGITLQDLMELSNPQLNKIHLINKIKQLQKKLNLKNELLERGLNENASGGERKKLELIQFCLINPKLGIFDEIDTGVDHESLKNFVEIIDQNRSSKCLIFITHNLEFLKMLKISKVLSICNLGMRELNISDFLKKNNYKK